MPTDVAFDVEDLEPCALCKRSARTPGHKRAEGELAMPSFHGCVITRNVPSVWQSFPSAETTRSLCGVTGVARVMTAARGNALRLSR